LNYLKIVNIVCDDKTIVYHGKTRNQRIISQSFQRASAVRSASNKAAESFLKFPTNRLPSDLSATYFYLPTRANAHIFAKSNHQWKSPRVRKKLLTEKDTTAINFQFALHNQEKPKCQI